MFFVTHSIEEAVFLGDRVYVMGRTPGTILQELEVEPADRPARLMQREPRFRETVDYIRDLISRLEKQGRRRIIEVGRIWPIPCTLEDRGSWVESSYRDPSPAPPSSSACEALVERAVYFGKYLKAAFLNHWNLLAFLGGAALCAAQRPARRAAAAGRWRAKSPTSGCWAAIPSSRATSTPRRRSRNGTKPRVASQQTLQQILRTLPPDLLQRFQSLRTQCLELRQIAVDLRRPGMGAADVPLGPDFNWPGLDRLLWIHLRLLYTQYALAKFLQEDQRRPDPAEHHGPGTADQAVAGRTTRIPATTAVRAALQDNLDTSRSRLANLTKAQRQLPAHRAGDRPPGEQDPLAQRDGRQPPGAGVHQQRGRPRRLEHGRYRADDERTAVRHRPGHG